MKSPFRYFNTQARNVDFFKTVKNAWPIPVVGSPIYKVVKKLASVKKALVRLQKLKGPDSTQIQVGREKLEMIHIQLTMNNNGSLLEVEKEAKDDLQRCLLLKENMLKAEVQRQMLESRGQ